jgi:predicted negative regulator of RcsB-dependent stress response
VDRLTRKELKTDEIAEKAHEAWDWSTAHKSQVVRYVAIVVGLGVLWLAYHFYSTYQAGVRQEALAKALHLDEGTVGPNVQSTVAHFDTEEAKTKATTTAFTDVASKYSGTQEGAIADLYLSGAAAEKGDTAEAEKRLRNVVEHAPGNYASLGRISLAQVLATEGKMADAEKMLRDAIANPSAMVSKESAQLALAQLLAKSNPAEAKKIVEPLRMLPSRTAITRAAIGLDGELSGPATAPAMMPVVSPVTTTPVK